MAQVLMYTSSQIPMVGASGAIGGVLGAYLVNHPNARVLVLIPFGFFSQLIKIRALYVLGFWFVLQFINSALSSPQGGGVAYAALIGGFISGIIVVFYFMKFDIAWTYYILGSVMMNLFVVILYSIVLEAFVASVACVTP